MGLKTLPSRRKRCKISLHKYFTDSFHLAMMRAPRSKWGAFTKRTFHRLFCEEEFLTHGGQYAQ
nr:MAG TPA: hypothetical protein [Caudoviricetes sp.]